MAYIKRYLLFLFIALQACMGWAQEEEGADVYIDDKYREDQLYIGVTYNLLTSVPSGVNLQGVSGGLEFGYLRDMPINERRNLAIALGAGFNFDQFGQTLFIGEDETENTIFRVLDNTINYSSNRFSTATVELPFEFRWRTSTAEEYRFWRIYTGFRVGYTYWYRARFKQDGNQVSQTDIPEFERLRLSAHLSFGYGTFNFYTSYSLNPYFTNAQTTNTGETIDFRTLKLGIIFYIL
ncbi:outer membrane beta-barrel protein [Aureisphaera galaxeae]|uniref:outer membrane beta-barrel protein n=1 Tax=Aureisphaera galaxeae TaxID=1538023 RepID=UPI002350BA6C|nr:outer membrane beta-barrel protein [Aureisphaera galaxeae]MDC8005917.1 outer membrane beta-barrel protein [Aureisphaera galaxeae]